MRPYKIYLKYTVASKLEEDLLQAKLVHPILNEFLYVKYIKKIKKLINWTDKKNNPIVKLKIINNGAVLLHNGRFINNWQDGSMIIHDALRRNGWLVDENDSREDRTILI